MDTMKELLKIKARAEALGVSHNDVAVKAGLSRFYIANATMRMKKDPGAGSQPQRVNKMKKVLDTIEAEQRKANGTNPGGSEVKDLIDLIFARGERLGITVTKVSDRLGLDKSYVYKLRNRMKKGYMPQRGVVTDNLKLHLLEMDKMDSERHAPAQGELPLPAAPSVDLENLRGPTGEPIMALRYDDVKVDPKAPGPVHVTRPTPDPADGQWPAPTRETAKPTANDVLRGMIAEKVAAMSTVQLALLLGHISGNE